MNTAKSSAHLAVASSTRCRVLAVGCTIERNSPTPAAAFNGKANSRLGGGLVLALLLTLLLAVVRHTRFVRVTRRGTPGKK